MEQADSTETDQATDSNRHVTFGQCPVLVNDDDEDDDAAGYDDFDADADNTDTNDTATNADTDSDSIASSNTTGALLPTPPTPNTKFSAPTDFMARDNGFVMGPEAMAGFLEQEGMTYGTNDDHDQDAIGDSLQKLQASADFSTDNGRARLLASCWSSAT
jgi:hypothetical protein